MHHSESKEDNSEANQAKKKDDAQSVQSIKSRTASALSSYRDEPDTTLAKIEEIQAQLMVRMDGFGDLVITLSMLIADVTK